jgi:ketosteroid isomerase-like protein
MLKTSRRGPAAHLGDLGDNRWTMSEESVAVVRRGFKAFVENDFEGWFAISSTEIKLYPPEDEPGVQPCYEGWDEMLDYLVNWYSGWEDYTVEAERFVDAGEWVVVDATEVGIAEQSGVRVEENFAHAFKLKDGKVVEWRMFRHVREALEALGVEEDQA